ncbi:Uncharacterized protein TCM_012209 [Theobroma cacao]|uniref:Uncharacterized protein n=1 Tax=Theobroma cacao TaxID=3641 RepID=A0A061G1E2_THECC|nr:Uncharacterized protein TCM_012209 [Theobroma cacao]
MHESLHLLHIHTKLGQEMIQSLTKRGMSLLSKSDSHGILWGDFETLKVPHGCGGLLFIFILYKGNASLCFNHSNFPESQPVLGHSGFHDGKEPLERAIWLI